MATESDVRQSPEGVRTYRGRTLEEILPQIREELGADAIILREREGLVGGVGGFFAQRFIEVEARRGEGKSIDIYDEDDLDPASMMDEAVAAQGLLPAGEPEDGDELDFSARRQTPVAEPGDDADAQPFLPPAVQRERIIPRDQDFEEPAAPAPEPEPPPRSFETDVFLERLRAASQLLPEDDEDEVPSYPGAAVPPPVAEPPVAEPPVAEPPVAEPPVVEPQTAIAESPELGQVEDLDDDAEEEPPRRRPQRRTPAERKPRASQPPGAQPRKPRAAARSKPATKPTEEPQPAPAPEHNDAWQQAMAALVAEPLPEPGVPSRPAPARPAAPRAAVRPPAAPRATTGYDPLRQRPPSLRVGLPTGPQAGPSGAAIPSTPVAQAAIPIPSAGPVVPPELRGRREGAIRGAISRLLGGRFATSTMPKASPPRPIDAAAAATVASKLAARGASEGWIAQLITTAGAHGAPLAGGLEAAVEAEIARRIVPAPVLPVTGAAVAFIGAGGSGKTSCTAALAAAYRRASTLGVTVVTIDNRGGERELKRRLNADGVPVFALRGEQAQRAVASARDTGFVIVDTPTATPTDPAAIEALAASLAPLELDAIFVTLPATLGPHAARRALASFGRLNPSAVAITHADETDQLAVVVEIAISHRIPLGFFHSGTDQLSALSAVEASELAQQLLAT
jgi:flagellar biosynthesis GTPase FlhF